MKVAGPFLIAAVVVLLSSSGRSQDAAGSASDSPYAGIVARNMFGLVPIPVVDPKDNQPPPDPPPKITPNGIMNMFGKEEVLFKVANKPKPGQPAKEDAHVLAVGEMEDEITVKNIDRADGNVTITFDNHGTIQDLPLIASKDSGGPAPTTGGPPGRVMPSPFPHPFPGVANRPEGMNPFQGQPVPTPNPRFGNNPGNPGAAPTETGLTPEQSVILRESRRAQYQQNDNSH